jgi:hypothetical protein
MVVVVGRGAVMASCARTFGRRELHKESGFLRAAQIGTSSSDRVKKRVDNYS